MKLFDRNFKKDLCVDLKKHRDRIESWRSDPDDSEALYSYCAMYADMFIGPIADREIKCGKIEGFAMGAILGFFTSAIVILGTKSKR